MASEKITNILDLIDALSILELSELVEGIQEMQQGVAPEVVLFSVSDVWIIIVQGQSIICGCSLNT